MPSDFKYSGLWRHATIIFLGTFAKEMSCGVALRLNVFTVVRV
jgi:hypothetical protein